MVALFLCLVFAAFLARARAYVYAHTNDIIDIYLLFIIYIRNNLQLYSKAKKDKERKPTNKRKGKEKKETRK